VLDHAQYFKQAARLCDRYLSLWSARFQSLKQVLQPLELADGQDTDGAIASQIIQLWSILQPRSSAQTSSVDTADVLNTAELSLEACCTMFAEHLQRINLATAGSGTSMLQSLHNTHPAGIGSSQTARMAFEALFLPVTAQLAQPEHVSAQMAAQLMTHLCRVPQLHSILVQWVALDTIRRTVAVHVTEAALQRTLRQAQQFARDRIPAALHALASGEIDFKAVQCATVFAYKEAHQTLQVRVALLLD